MMNELVKLVFFFLYIQFSFAQSPTKLEKGDLLFININCGEMCEAINAVTEGYHGLKFNHVGLVDIDEKGGVWLYEAVEKGVVKTPLRLFLAYTKQPVYVGKLANEYHYLIPKVLDFCNSQLGVPYDHDFLYDNGKYYCSELIYDAFLFANEQEDFFQMYPMNYKEPYSEEYYAVWIKHFEERGMEVPQGKLGCNPGAMSMDEKIIMKEFIK